MKTFHLFSAMLAFIGLAAAFGIGIIGAGGYLLGDIFWLAPSR